MLALLQGTVVLARDSENNVEDDSDLVGKLLGVLRKRPASRGVSGFLKGSFEVEPQGNLDQCHSLRNSVKGISTSEHPGCR